MSISQVKLPPHGDAAQPPAEKPAAPRWSPLGKHRYYVEDDLVVLEVSGGEFSLADSQMLIDVVESVQNRLGYYLLLGDITRGISLTSAVRRKIADWATSNGPNPVTALVGASLPARAALALAIHAMRLLGRANYKTEFFPEVEAGLNWLHGQREHARLRRKAR